MTAYLKAKHRKFTVGKRKAEEMIPEIHKYINMQVGQRIPMNLIQFHSFLILSGSKKISLIIVILLQLNETESMAGFISAFVKYENH